MKASQRIRIGSPDQTAGDGVRDEKGRFVRGNPGGPGNPNAGRAVLLKNACSAAVSEAQVIRVIRSLYKQALRGDVAAARLLLERVVGRLKEETVDESMLGFNPSETFL